MTCCPHLSSFCYTLSEIALLVIALYPLPHFLKVKIWEIHHCIWLPDILHQLTGKVSLTYWEKEGKRNTSSAVKQHTLRITCKAYLVSGSLVVFSNVFHFYVLHRYKGFSSHPCACFWCLESQSTERKLELFRTYLGKAMGKETCHVRTQLPSKWSPRTTLAANAE